MNKFCLEVESADDTLPRSVSSSAGRSENGHAGCWCRQSSQPVLLERVADDLGDPDAAVDQGHDTARAGEYDRRMLPQNLVACQYSNCYKALCAAGSLGHGKFPC
jgi:hypothetical protein